MEIERSFRNLFALCLKKWRSLIVGAVIGAVLLGAVQYILQMGVKNNPDMSETAIEARYQASMAEYNTQVNQWKGEIFENEVIISNTQGYLDNSLLMRIDPYNKYINVIDLSVDIEDEEAFLQSYGTNATPVDYMVNKVLNQYWVTYKSINIGDLPALREHYANVEEKYWDEVIKVRIKDGGLLEIEAFGTSAEEAEMLVDAIYGYLCSKTETLCEAAYQHSLIEISHVAKTSIDTDLATQRESKQMDVADAQGKVAALNASINGLPVPGREMGFSEAAMRQAVKRFSMIGALVGIVFAMFVVMIHCVTVKQVITSQEIMEATQLIMVGAISKRTLKKDRKMMLPSDMITGERVWNSKSQAVDYIAGSIGEFYTGNTVVLSSSIEIAENDERILLLKEKLEEKKYEVSVVMDALHNSNFAHEAKNASIVLLLEKPLNSRLTVIDEVKGVCSSVGANQVGFVLLEK